ncbi:hypothetical protein JMUB7519_27830 [Staphylococcus aureus]
MQRSLVGSEMCIRDSFRINRHLTIAYMVPDEKEDDDPYMEFVSD